MRERERRARKEDIRIFIILVLMTLGFVAGLSIVVYAFKGAVG